MRNERIARGGRGMRRLENDFKGCRLVKEKRGGAVQA